MRKFKVNVAKLQSSGVDVARLVGRSVAASEVLTERELNVIGDEIARLARTRPMLDCLEITPV